MYPRVLHKNFYKTGRLTDHFWLKEFKCKGKGCCGGSAPINPDLVFRLEDLRELIGGVALTPNSGFRCEKHNAETDNASPTSLHRLGLAADIRWPRGVDREVFVRAALRVGFYVIRYDWGIHVDLRNVLAGRK